MSYLRKMLLAVLAACFIGGPVSYAVGANNRVIVGVAVGALTYALLSVRNARVFEILGALLAGSRFTNEGKQILSEIDQKLALNPNDCISYVARADLFRSVKDYRRAIADCDKALELDPRNAEAHNLRGAILDGRGEYQAAIQEYDKALEGNMACAKFFYNRGVAYAHLQRYDEAVSNYVRAIELDPTDPSIHNNLGLAYLELGRLNDAIAEYTRAIALDPKHTTAYDNRGYAYMQAGRIEEGCRDWYRAAKFGMRRNWDVAANNGDVPASVFFLPEFTTDEHNLAPDSHPESPQEDLIRAVRAADKDRVLGMLQVGSEADARARGVAPLHVAAERGLLEIAEALLNAGAEIDAQCENNPQLGGRTPLTLAVAARAADMILLLVKRGANINARDGSGLTALGSALMPMHTLFLDSERALHWDCSIELVELLLKNGADPNQWFDFREDDSEDLPKHLAVAEPNGKIWIWERQFRRAEGITPLMAAAMDPGHNRAKAVAEVLIGHGADANVVSRDGKTAIQIAEESKNWGLAKLLRGAIDLSNRKHPVK